MKVESHLAKFRRLDSMLRRLDPLADQELWIWTAMNAGVHLLNAALHRGGVTSETDSFHTQVEGVYVVLDPVGGGMHDRMHAPGDIMHVEQPKLHGPLPAAVERASNALRTIEDLREAFVRGPRRAEPDEARQWEQAYESCVRELVSLLDERREETT